MWDWVLATVGLMTALYWYMSQHHTYWKAKGVYSPPGVLPGVGHMWDAFVLKKSAGWLHCEMYNQAKSYPAVGIYSFRQPALLLRDLNLIQAVLIREFSNFHDNTMTADEKLDPLVAKNPFVMKGQRWKTLRQQLTPAFSSSKIKAMFPLLQKVCQEFNAYMEKHLNEDIDINYITGLFTSEVVAKCAFAVDGNAFADAAKSEFYQHGRKIWDASVYNPFVTLLYQYFPIIRKLLRKSFIPKETMAFFVSIINQAADYRLRNPEKVPDNDYLQYLLNLHNKNSEFTLEDVIAQSLTFFVDGFESSSMAASFVLYELTMHPEIQEAVRLEVKSVDFLTFDITSLSLLDRVFQEALRKYSVFSLSKECTKDTVLELNGYSYPVYKGQEVLVPVYAIHHNPEIYPDPDRFDPDRFLPENIKNQHPSSFLAFGTGPRMCIGYKFATFQVKAIIANILSKFRLLKCKNTEENVTLNKLHFTPVSDKKIWIQFERL